MSRSDRWVNRDILLATIKPIITSRSVADLYDQLTAAGIVSSPIYTLDQTFDDPQVRHRQVTGSVDFGTGTPVKMVRNPIRFSSSAVSDLRASPTLGQHNEAYLPK